MHFNFPSIGLALWLGLFVSFESNAQSIRAQQLAPHTYALMGRGGNIGVFVGADEIFVVDSQYEDLTESILETIDSIASKPIRFLVNTHSHSDHIGGNSNFAARGTTIIAHQKVLERLIVQNFDSLGNPRGRIRKSHLPKITFTDQLELQTDPHHQILVFHVEKAHTDGDCIVYFSTENVLHMGDVFFNGRFPFIHQEAGGTIDGVIAAVNQALILCTEETVVIPGHGVVGTTTDLKNYRDMLQTIRDRIFKAKKKGESLAEIIAQNPTKEWNTTHGQARIKPHMFVEDVFKSLSL